MFNPVAKGALAELSVADVLASYFPDSAVVDASKQPNSGDLWLVHPEHRTLIEIKNYA